MTEDQIIKKLAKEVLSSGGQRAFARENLMSQPYVNDVLHGKRKPGPKILKALGLSAKTVYERA